MDIKNGDGVDGPISSLAGGQAKACSLLYPVSALFWNVSGVIGFKPKIAETKTIMKSIGS
ncbi:MAG: hypothetical protein ACYC3O_12745 [Burkholderiales bacterium]